MFLSKSYTNIVEEFFQALALSVLLYGCTAWTLTNRMEKKLDGIYTNMQRTVLKKSWNYTATSDI